MTSKNAFITIIGRANAGKSSLLNALVGEKIAAVSAKPQTTRTKITGVVTRDETQLVFIDTPGMHKAKTKLSAHMMKAIGESVKSVDVIILMADGTKSPSDAEKNLIAGISKNTKAYLCVNKIDLIDKDKLLERLAEYSSLYDFEEVFPISVLQNDGLDKLSEKLYSSAHDGPHYFDDEAVTDQPEKVLISEKIREKALLCLNEEIPHGIAVAVEEVSEHDSRNGEAIMDINAVIFCERESHKGIIIGKHGAMLKKIGQLAREDLEDFFRIKVGLKLWVKVKDGWRNNENYIRNFGLSQK